MTCLWLALFLCASLPAQGADPDWTKWNAYAVDLLQRYIRIPTIDPPADTRPTAALIRDEFQKHGFAVTLYPSGPAGQTNLVIRLKGKSTTAKP